VDVDNLDELLLESAVWFYLLSFLFLLFKLHLLFVLFSFHAPDNSVFPLKLAGNLPVSILENLFYGVELIHEVLDT